MNIVLLFYINGFVIHNNIEYTAIGYQLLGLEGLHLFLQSSEYNTAIYLEINLTTINGVLCTTTTQIIDLLGNPPELNS